jgi:peptidoglycan/xylan/chitin deacetylase (PgdA/CDA1 family)
MQRPLFSALLLALCASVSAAHAEGVALTFDDLPTMSLRDAEPYAAITTETLLGGLRRRHLPATGFVIGENLEGARGAAQTRLVDAWLTAGMDIGNHTYSHTSLNKTPVRAYVADVSRTGGILRPLVAAHHRSLVWFRHPYLETGLTLDVRRTFEDWVGTHGYRIAPVTMENADWMFALPYDDAILRRDTAGAARIKQAYLDYTAKVVSWYRTAALGLLGRRPSFIFLLHATRLNADSIDPLADILHDNDLRPITLKRAMKDPAYKIADTYVGPDGDEWLSRWSRTLHKDLPWASFPKPPADIAAENDRLDINP